MRLSSKLIILWTFVVILSALFAYPDFTMMHWDFPISIWFVGVLPILLCVNDRKVKPSKDETK